MHAVSASPANERVRVRSPRGLYRSILPNSKTDHHAGVFDLFSPARDWNLYSHCHCHANGNANDHANPHSISNKNGEGHYRRSDCYSDQGAASNLHAIPDDSADRDSYIGPGADGLDGPDLMPSLHDRYPMRQLLHIGQ